MKKLTSVIVLGIVALFLGLGIGFLLSRLRNTTEPKRVTSPPPLPQRELTIEERIEAMRQFEDPEELRNVDIKERRRLLEKFGTEDALSEEEQQRSIDLFE